MIGLALALIHSPSGTESEMKPILFVLATWCSAAVCSAEPPNFLVFLADDCTYHDFGCYGNSDVRTPNIDALARDGMLFRHAYNSAPMCAPTRMSLYTGIHPVRNGGHPNHSRVYDHIQSFPHYLRPLGYQVALIGKTHHAPAKNFPFQFLGGRHHDNGKGVDLELDQVDAFLAANRERPWCLMVNSNQPHTPWNRGDPSRYDPARLKLPAYFVDTELTRQELAKYYAEITYMDEQVGRCLAMLKSHDLDRQTVVVFLSEQGSNFPHCKWTCYDSGLRSAQIVRWPGQVAAGVTTNAMVQYVDLLPTCIELAGGDLQGQPFDGRSYAGLLRGATSQHRSAVFGVQTSRSIYHGPTAYGIRTVRDRRYRLIWNVNAENRFTNSVVAKSKVYASWKTKQGDAFARAQYERYQRRPEFELYDMERDPYELQNIIDDPQHAATAESLKAQLATWMRQQGDEGADTELRAVERVDFSRNPKARELK